MQRRDFMLAAGAAGLEFSAQESSGQGAPKRQYFEMHWFFLRNGAQTKRTEDFLSKVYAPCLKKLGLPPTGFFQPVIGEGSPYWLALISLPSMESVETAFERLGADPDYRKGADEYMAGDPPYVRRETSLLRAFSSMPSLTVPPAKENGSRIFEIRTYESNTSVTLRRKIKMFEDGEIGIFRRLGMQPVFFAETVIGRNLPSLTYMLAYDDLAARDRVWKAFGADPEWQKLRSAPGNSDAEIVSNISNLIVRPASFSEVK